MIILWDLQRSLSSCRKKHFSLSLWMQGHVKSGCINWFVVFWGWESVSAPSPVRPFIDMILSNRKDYVNTSYLRCQWQTISELPLVLAEWYLFLSSEVFHSLACCVIVPRSVTEDSNVIINSVAEQRSECWYKKLMRCWREMNCFGWMTLNAA